MICNNSLPHIWDLRFDEMRWISYRQLLPPMKLVLVPPIPMHATWLLPLPSGPHTFSIYNQIQADVAQLYQSLLLPSHAFMDSSYTISSWIPSFLFDYYISLILILQIMQTLHPSHFSSSKLISQWFTLVT